MRLQSIDGNPVHVGLVSGHSIVIQEARNVPQQFVADAMKTGRVMPARDEGTVREQAPVAQRAASPEGAADKLAKIKEVIKEALEADDKSLFTATGTPDARKLDKLVGQPVSAAERDQAWAELQAEAAEE